jgi:hypothetical protein
VDHAGCAVSRRARLEARGEKREDWAAGRGAKAAASFDRADLREEKSGIPFGQPVLVGHHSEGRHRRALERADNAIRSGVEHSKMASHHAGAAEGIRAQLDRSIFSDDDNACDKLEEKAKACDARAEQANTINKAWRKGYKAGGEAGARVELAKLGLALPTIDRLVACALQYSWLTKAGPMDAKHDRAEARRCRLRIADIRRRTTITAKAEAAGGATIEGGAGVRVTFAEYPGRPIVAELKAAGFFWSAPSWHGDRERLPAEVVNLATDLGAVRREDDGPPERVAAFGEKLAILLAGMRGEDGRNPQVELRGAEEDTATIVDWSGPLADFVEGADDAARWSAETWSGIAKLSRGDARVYLGGGAVPLVVLQRAAQNEAGHV